VATTPFYVSFFIFVAERASMLRRQVGNGTLKAGPWGVWGISNGATPKCHSLTYEIPSNAEISIHYAYDMWTMEARKKKNK